MQREEAIKFEGKGWGEMTNDERHAFWLADAGTATKAAEQHHDRPWIGKAFGDLTNLEMHRLANDEPRLYEELRAAHEKENG